MRVRLKTPVEYDGATFDFVPDDASFWRVQEGIGADLELLGKPVATLDELSAVTQAALGAFFEASVVGWSGVEGEDGKPLDCTPANRSAIDPLQKALVVYAYFGEREALRGNVPAPASPPTNSTPPAPTEGS